MKRLTLISLTFAAGLVLARRARRVRRQRRDGGRRGAGRDRPGADAYRARNRHRRGAHRNRWRAFRGAAAGPTSATASGSSAASPSHSVSRTHEATQAVGAAALTDLLAGPTEVERSDGISTAVPAGTRLLGLVVSDGLATVDLSSEFESGGGSLSMMARLGQVDCTLDQFPTVDGVSFELDGEPVDVFSGEGIVLDKPVDLRGLRGPAARDRGREPRARCRAPERREGDGQRERLRGERQLRAGRRRPHLRRGLHDRDLRNRLPRRLLLPPALRGRQARSRPRSSSTTTTRPASGSGPTRFAIPVTLMPS